MSCSCVTRTNQAGQAAPRATCRVHVYACSDPYISRPASYGGGLAWPSLAARCRCNALCPPWPGDTIVDVACRHKQEDIPGRRRSNVTIGWTHVTSDGRIRTYVMIYVYIWYVHAPLSAALQGCAPAETCWSMFAHRCSPTRHAYTCRLRRRRREGPCREAAVMLAGLGLTNMGFYLNLYPHEPEVFRRYETDLCQLVLQRQISALKRKAQEARPPQEQAIRAL